MGCGEFLVKYILFFANFFFALSGLALLGLGIAVQLQLADLSGLADGQVQVAPIFTMVLGSIVFLVAFFGCCGAIRESNCMLVTYSIFMLLMMVAKIALATIIFVGMDNLLNEIRPWLNTTFNNNNDGFHAIESTFKCCGPTGSMSYGSQSLPNSCCDTPPCIKLINAYSGCDDVLQDFFHNYGLVIGIIAIVIGAIELVAAVFGLCLANHVRNKYRRNQY